MGARGPAPAPTALKLLKGTQKARINTAEPVPATGEVVRPELSEAAATVWDALAPDLIAKKILTPWDVDTLAAFCELVIQNRIANANLAEHGNRITVVSRELSDGTLIYSTTKNPAWQIAKESAALIVTLGGRFGLNPSDRSNLKVGDGSKQDDRESFLT